MKTRIAQFRNLDYKAIDIYAVGEDKWLLESKKYVQVSEIIEVEFIPIDKKIIIDKEIDFIDDSLNDLKTQFLANKELLEQRKAELVCLPDLTGVQNLNNTI